MLTLRQILKKAWQITWQNPALWFFGIFVALLGAGGEIEILWRSVTLGQAEGDKGLLWSFLSGFIDGKLFTLAAFKGFFKALVTQPLVLFIMMLILMVVIGIVVLLVWLTIVSQTGLVNGVIDSVKSNKKTTWGKNFAAGVYKFWPVLSLNAIVKILFWLLFMILGYIATLNFIGYGPLFIVSFVIFILSIIIVSLIIKYAIFAVVIRNSNFSDSIKSAVDLFRKNWLLSLEVAVVLFVIYCVANSIFAIPRGLMFLYGLKLYNVSPIIFYSINVLIVVFFVIIQMFLAIFHWTSWVLVYEVISSKTVKMSSRLVEIFYKIFS